MFYPFSQIVSFTQPRPNADIATKADWCRFRCLSLKRYVETGSVAVADKPTDNLRSQSSRHAARIPENDGAAKLPYPLDTYAKWPLTPAKIPVEGSTFQF